MWKLLLVLAIALSLLPSCRPLAKITSEEPIVILLSPGSTETRNAGDVEVRIYLQNFKIVEDTGQANMKNEGHVIYYLDVSAPLEPGTSATTDPGTYAVSTATLYTWPNVPPGQHVFTVQLVNNDNTPLTQPVTVRANVTLR